MSHMVIYRGADGKPGYHQTDDIHEAIGFVEQMRNDDGVEHARIFRLEEVVFEYRPYYRVELSAAGMAPTVLGGPQPAQLPEAEAAGPLNMTPPTPVGENGETIDLVDEVIDVVDQYDDGQAKAEAGAAKKGLFGR